MKTRARVAGLFDGEYLQQRLAEANEILRGDREGLLPPDEFDQLRIETRQIKKAADSCLVVAGNYVTVGTSVGGGSIITAFSLRRADEGRNVTGWQLIDVVRSLDRSGQEIPEALMLDATVSDLAHVLDNSCAGRRQ